MGAGRSLYVVIWVALWGAVICLPDVAVLAQPAPAQASGRDAEARSLFQAGAIAVRDGRYEAAIDYFKKAYALSSRPALLFNIATTADKLRRDAEALDYFRRYLRELPDANNAPAVRVRIKVLEKAARARKAAAQTAAREALAQEAAAREAAAREAAARQAAARQAAALEAASGDDPVDETGRDAGALSDTAADVPTTPEVQGEEASVGGPLTPTLTWSLVGAAGAVAAGGSVLLIMAGSERDLVEGAEDGARWDELQQSYDRVSLYSTLGLVGMGVGLAGAATLLTLHFLGGDESPVEPTVALGPTGLVLGGRW